MDRKIGVKLNRYKVKDSVLYEADFLPYFTYFFRAFVI